MRISDVLRHKGSAVCTVAPYTPMLDLLSLLHERNIGAVVITDGDSVVGIVSERDVVRGLRDRGADLLGLSAGDIMTRTVLFCDPGDTVDSLAETMTERRIRHVPVLDGGRLTGIVSIGDVVKSRITQLENDREQLESYIARG
ncbi:CBS domain-containing protein [Aldersonia sp. NBC_00410]|uniref:CBS domain-containing protein n=1 Tax=Aldersonia sp. NBC_00410 TaxID=2975954 RepID=UPI0022547C9B|nr:CBS domain-containing protein [Aldersonia sp. NBC_00410]MCX5046606.1 CBS domain-containing protein [Aldersonia sp. NBC_00410]